MEIKPGIKVNRNNTMITVKKNQKMNLNSNIARGKVPGLPKDFFETVLDCEVKLKQRFDMRVLQKLIDYYSIAVGYYESINDPKFMIYNQSLSLLFSQPEVKQYLTGGNLKMKLKKENIQKIIQECDKKITNEKVKNFIKRKSTVESKKQINELINKDIDTQANDFKKRLEEKKKKYRLSTSDIAGNNEIGKSLKNFGIGNNNENKMNKSIELAPEKEFISSKEMVNINNGANSDKNIIIANENNANNIQNNGNNAMNNILEELKNEDLKNENKINNDENNNLNDSFENKLDYNLETNDVKSLMTKTSIKFTNKTRFIEKMKLYFDIYANDYYEHFIKKVADQIIKDYNSNYHDLTQTLMDSTVNYINQEKEMEFLLNSDSDESYKREIGTIVQQLKDEEKLTKDKLIGENKEKVDKLNEKYMGTLNSIQSSHDLEMVKERFKLDTTKTLNTLVFK